METKIQNNVEMRVKKTEMISNRTWLKIFL